MKKVKNCVRRVFLPPNLIWRWNEKREIAQAEVAHVKIFHENLTKPEIEFAQKYEAFSELNRKYSRFHFVVINSSWRGYNRIEEVILIDPYRNKKIIPRGCLVIFIPKEDILLKTNLIINSKEEQVPLAWTINLRKNEIVAVTEKNHPLKLKILQNEREWELEWEETKVKREKEEKEEKEEKTEENNEIQMRLVK